MGRRPLSAEIKLNMFKQNLLNASTVGPSIPARFTTEIMPVVFRIFGNMSIEQRKSLLNGTQIRVAELSPACQKEIFRYLQIVGQGRLPPSIGDAVITTQSNTLGGRASFTIRVRVYDQEYPCTIYIP